MRRPIVLLMVSNLLGGVGVAVGVAVGALLVQQVAGTTLAGLGAAVVVLGSAVVAVPLAQLAARRGRRQALAVGHLVAALGSAATVLGAVLWSAPVLLVGGFLFGAGQATSLQTRFAAADHPTGRRKAMVISLVFWMTTLGSLLGLNLATSADEVGRSLHLPDLSGSFVYAGVAFLLASLVVLGLPGHGAVAAPSRTTAALRWAAHQPTARYAVVLAVVAHAVMVGVMSMAPLELVGHGHGLRGIGVLVSVHILGMFALSPAIGWLADRIGATRTSRIGLVVLLAACLVGAVGNERVAVTAASLGLLGLGWSICVLSSSALLAGIDAGSARVPLQGRQRRPDELRRRGCRRRQRPVDGRPGLRWRQPGGRPAAGAGGAGRGGGRPVAPPSSPDSTGFAWGWGGRKVGRASSRVRCG